MSEQNAAPNQPAVTPRRTKPKPTWNAWVEAILADWRAQWPAAFTKPVPLAIGIDTQIKEALIAAGKPVDTIDPKLISRPLYHWTAQSGYLRSIIKGEPRRNLDGSEAGTPDEQATGHAQKLLDERAAVWAEKQRLRRDGEQFPDHQNQKEP